MAEKTLKDQLVKDKKLVEFNQNIKRGEQLIDELNIQLQKETDSKKRDKIAAKIADIICGYSS